MKQDHKHQLVQFKKRWQLLLLTELLCYAIGAAVLIYLISAHLVISVITFLLVGTLCTLVIKPWKADLEATSSFLDAEFEALEYSTGLLLEPSHDLSQLAQLQQLKIKSALGKVLKGAHPPNRARQGSLVALAMIVLGILLNQFHVADYFKPAPSIKTEQNLLSFSPEDSTGVVVRPPKIVNQFITVSYPSYIDIQAYTSKELNISAVEGSRIRWNLQFDGEVDSVFLQSSRTSYPMQLQNGTYTGSSVLQYSGFYNFKFKDLQGNTYSTDLFSIDVTKDEAPEVKLIGINPFTSFNFEEDKIVRFNTRITDDYGVSEAYIIATVSKGSGEAVKFREEQLSFDDPVVQGSKNLRLTKQIDLDQMKMDLGDELYFYVEVSDLKLPKPNFSRSETYFVVLKDTVTNEFMVEATMGVDRMPAFFRSQRQLIIDTEKLIEKRGKIAAKDFNFESNELGFDQKALRLKYGEFMGEESEMEGTGGALTDEASEHHDHDHDHDHEDPLAGFKHDHDSENEHNLVPDKSKQEGAKNPLDEFIHNHDDPEEATLFTASLRVKLREMLNEMWDAELYLRLYEPEKSLPYQYRALRLIQEIKNSARIYVHRIGFDPPPIKEEKRLSGELEAVVSYRKTENLAPEANLPFVRESIIRLEQLKGRNEAISSQDKLLFEKAGNELATLAIESPGKYLTTLQQLKWLSEGKKVVRSTYLELQQSLMLAIPKPKDIPKTSRQFKDEMTQLLIKELEIND
ncbi:MAG TPA: hypothetical protein VJ953_00115 [Saprospiraceae bacterium]|nr:hypothetical protein [Saprospiraceae bacterium]